MGTILFLILLVLVVLNFGKLFVIFIIASAAFGGFLFFLAMVFLGVCEEIHLATKRFVRRLKGKE